ncbi:hypothetical protein [Nocardia sp. NPDC127526]|uniref:hypothetical protein n=1 Tax=Nocardia sp. NPDC127526 TaxID=3345393 RepID=UPI003628ECEB
MITTANIFHTATALLCLAVAVLRVRRWRDTGTRAMTVALFALSALVATTLANGFEWESQSIGPTYLDMFSYACAVIVSAALIYLAARAWSFTRLLWLTHAAAAMAGGFIATYGCLVIHYHGASQAQFMLIVTACIAGTSGLLLFVASLAAAADPELPRAARSTLLILAAASLLWAVGAARRAGDNVTTEGWLTTFAQHLPWESVSYAAILFAIAGAAGAYLPWRDEAPLKPDLEDHEPAQH